MYFFRSTLLLVVGWMSFHPIFGQNLTPTSARSVGLAETNTIISDPWGIINNPAGLSESNERSHLLLSYHNRYIAYGIHDAVFGFTVPIGRLTSAAAVSFFGDELLNETKASLILADHIGISQLGLRVNYHQLAVMNYGSAHAFSIDLGGTFNISDEFVLAMLIANLGQAKYNTENLSRVPTAMSIGVAYRPYHELSLQAQVDKDLNSPMDARFGLEYQPHHLLMLRTGVSTLQPTAYLGFGLITHHLIFDLAGQYNADLGFSAIFSFDIAFGKE